jgi:transcriptional regulator with XRE-family HTH domain
MHAYLTRPNRYSPILVPAFGAWVRHRRLEQGLSCGRAATMTGIDRSEWRTLEQGRVPFGNESLIRSIANTLGIRYDAFLDLIAPIENHFEHTEDSVAA